MPKIQTIASHYQSQLAQVTVQWKCGRKTLSLESYVNNTWASGHLDGSVGWASNFVSGHNLMVCEFEPHVGLFADSSEPQPASDSVPPSLSAPPPHLLTFSLSLSLSKINKRLKRRRGESESSATGKWMTLTADTELGAGNDREKDVSHRRCWV